MSSLFALVYTSQATKGFDDSTLMEIFAISRRNNLRDQITGFLIYREGYFLQLLEGPEAKVRECFARIQKDHRHRALVLQGEAHSSERMMPDWSMGQVTLKPGQPTSDRIIDLFELARNNQIYENSDSLMSLVKIFSKDAVTF
jgi:hypothetical protein